MSESKQRRRRHLRILEDNPSCIYCGGIATTVEHMPPMVIFWGRNRPKGFEFPSCEQCNSGTRRSDQVAGLMSRLYPDPVSPEHGEEVTRLLGAINNNYPGLLEEMQIGRGGEKLARKRVPANVEGGFFRIGPLVHHHMQIFAAKLGFALWFHATGRVVPPSGGVLARWYSNVDHWQGNIPESLFSILGPPQTLRQGMKHVGDQFSYAEGCTPDGRLGAFFSTFRMSFAVINVASDDRSLFDRFRDVGARIYQPGEITVVS